MKDSTNNANNFHNYIFSYGSLICPHSRTVTAPTVAERSATPVRVENIERTWSKHSRRNMTAMGVRFRKDAFCTGVLIPVTEKELAQFDIREEGYDRLPLDIEDICTVSSVDEKKYYHNNEHYQKLFGSSSSKQSSEDDEDSSSRPASSSTANVNIWVYVPQKECLPTEEHPIVQSYVDTMLRGCLTYSEEFAKEFIQSTKGWEIRELILDDDNDDDNVPNNNDDEGSDNSDNDSSNDDNNDDDSSNDETDSNSASSDDDNNNEDQAMTTSKIAFKKGSRHIQQILNNSRTTNGVYWTNDRHDPIYIRGDQNYMLKHGPVLDNLLQKLRPKAFHNRKRLRASRD